MLVSRTTEPASHDWTANNDDEGHHHGLLDANEVPCVIALYWQSKRAGRAVHVGTFRVRLRQLAKAGYAVMKPGNKVRLRFVRDDHGVINIQVNDGSPELPVGRLDFPP